MLTHLYKAFKSKSGEQLDGRYSQSEIGLNNDE
ncbi:hypothetical protein X564_15935 [Pseudoalteromonas agarivorans]|nr:hypothetical protein X564_15935 [Pseudoalteromonas agarivorans]